MTAGLMRRLAPISLAGRFSSNIVLRTATPPLFTYSFRQTQRSLANIRGFDLAASTTWFSGSPPCWVPESSSNQDGGPPDERTLKLGKTIRVIHERLPNLLASPLPSEILSPHITLHLFPSSHPHLPHVGGRIAYTAALWTAPVAWGCIPVLGNVKLNIVSERMVRHGGSSVGSNMRDEKLVVKWKTIGKSKNKSEGVYSGISAKDQVDRFKSLLRGEAKEQETEFCGLFIFEFDEEGRVLKHTIEHTEEGGSYDKTNKVISVTDWLLGRAWGHRGHDGNPGLALGYCDITQRRPHMSNRRQDRDEE